MPTGGGTGTNLTINHQDTSTQASLSTSNDTTVTALTLDTYGHVTALTSVPIGISITGNTSGTLTVGRGGTNATTAAGARTSLGLEIGTDVQAYGINLNQISSLGQVTGADRIMVSTGVGAWTYKSGATARGSLGLTIGTDVQAYDEGLSEIAALTDPNADRLLGWVDGGDAYGFYSAGTGISIGSNSVAVSGNLADIAGRSDPNEDRILFWDDSADALKWLDLGDGLTIAGTSILTDVRENSGEMLFGPTMNLDATSRSLSTYLEARINGTLYYIPLYT